MIVEQLGQRRVCRRKSCDAIVLPILDIKIRAAAASWRHRSCSAYSTSTCLLSQIGTPPSYADTRSPASTSSRPAWDSCSDPACPWCGPTDSGRICCGLKVAGTSLFKAVTSWPTSYSKSRGYSHYSDTPFRRPSAAARIPNWGKPEAVWTSKTSSRL